MWNKLLSMRFICTSPADDEGEGRKGEDCPLRPRLSTKAIIHSIPNATSLFFFKPTNK